MNYFNEIINYISQNLYKKFNLKVGVVSDDKRNVQFITNNSASRSINIYRLTSFNDVDNGIQTISRDLLMPI